MIISCELCASPYNLSIHNKEKKLFPCMGCVCVLYCYTCSHHKSHACLLVRWTFRNLIASFHCYHLQVVVHHISLFIAFALNIHKAWNLKATASYVFDMKFLNIPFNKKKLFYSLLENTLSYELTNMYMTKAHTHTYSFSSL